MNIKIEKIGDITKFAKWLIQEKKINFHPDNAFEDYITPERKPLFDARESEALENTLEQCRFLAENEGADIYVFGHNFLRFSCRK